MPLVLRVISNESLTDSFHVTSLSQICTVTYSSDLFLDIFCVYTQSSDAMGLIFHAKLTVCFISNIYAGFILLKKCAQVLKIECAMECPPL